ncbi:MAG: hypothetical protein K6E99_04290 [Bacilli bacterium]|nr:hypothetical protein [Bacilli bacterium]
MKKAFKLFLMILCLIPLAVKADMGAPYIKPIDAVITKKGGITAKNYDGKTKHFAENAVVKISGLGENIEIYTDSQGYYRVSESDVKYVIPKTKEVKPGDDGVEKLDKQKEFEVTVQELKVYKGPSVIFDEAGSISKGTQVTAFYSFQTDEALSEWFYIQEESVSGWIDIGSETDKYTVYEVNAKPLKVIFKKTVTINGTEVKGNAIYKINYWANPYLGTNPVVKINNENVSFDDFETIEIFGDSKKKQSIFHMEQYNFLLKKETKLYTSYSLTEEITTIPAQTELSTINLVYAYGLQGDDEYYLYVNYNNKIGWIKVKPKDVSVNEKDYGVDELISPFVDPEGDDGEDDTEETTQVVQNNETEKTKKKIDSKETIIISVIASVSAAILAIGTIFVLNKKDKKSTLKEINEELEKTQRIEVVKEDTTDEK